MAKEKLNLSLNRNIKAQLTTLAESKIMNVSEYVTYLTTIEFASIKNPKALNILYANWRRNGEEQSKGTDIPFTWDCGQASARGDFSDYVGTDIEFEEMLELENKYK